MNLSILYKKLTNRKYTIGYKFILSLFVGFVGIISFGYCEDVFGLLNTYEISSVSYEGKNGNYSTLLSFGDIGQKIVCVSLSPGTNNITIGFAERASDVVSEPYRIWADWGGKYSCLVKGANTSYLLVRGGTNGGSSVNGNYFYLDDLLGTELPVLSSLECEEKYNLIPIENVDSNYCLNNNLCPLTSGNWSSLFINNIQYPGAPTIKLTIPEEIERDQNTDEEETNIDVIGYGYDQDKMQQMVNTQYYKPTAKEMSGLMEKVADFLPLVAVALLIARIRRVIKKVF